jgi:exo-1,4-beta-D-glucosaminidase
MRARSRIGFAVTCLLASSTLVLPALSQGAVAATGARSAPAAQSAPAAATRTTPGGTGTGLTTLGTGGWEVQSSAAATTWTTDSGATQSGAQISTPGFSTSGWLPVTADDAGAVGTEVEALLQNGLCPDDPALQPVNQSSDSPSSVFYSNNMQLCFGNPQTSVGADTNALFDVPWWFRTDFTANLQSGQDAKLVINGVVGQADVWVNGTEVATEATVEGDYTTYSFDVTSLLKSGTNSLALELFPNNPGAMFTLDDVDWNQIPPDNNTGVQFPVQLHVSDALGISNAYVTQNDATDLSSAALTVHADVTNNTTRPQDGVVTASVAPPGGGQPVSVSKKVEVPPGVSQTITFLPKSYKQLDLSHPQLWWPYQMGGQPLYTLTASVSDGGVLSDSAPAVTFGIRSVTTYLTAPSAEEPDGARVFEINGVPFDYRAGGWSENLFLHYSSADLASQLTLIKSMGLDGIRTEGKEMPQDFYNQMDAAGILIDAGFQCCDKWAPSSSGRGVSSQEFHVMYESSLTIGEQLRDHPSVINFSWSDNPPINEQEVASTEGFNQAGFQDPNISSAEYNVSGILGPSGEKEGPYDWVPPTYFYDTTHASNNGNDNDSTLTNVGGSFGFDSEQGSGDTVPTMDSISRFMSPSDQSSLWQSPDAHQYHTNYESTSGQHSGYAFGTLDNLDNAIKARYGSWSSLPQFVQEAQVQNYEDTRAQFEAYIDHWDNEPTPSTGTVYWQLNKGWPTLLWDLYNSDYDEAGSYFGAKKANETLHVLYAYDTGGVTIDNLSGVKQTGLSVESKVYGINGNVLDDQTTSGSLSLQPQQVENGVLTPDVPASTTPPAPAQSYFVETILRQNSTVVDRNVYWLSTQQDVINWNTTEGNPQANNGSALSQYANLTALQSLASEGVQVAADTQPAGNGKLTTTVVLTNPSSNSAVAFFLRADVRRGNPDGSAQSGDNEVLPVDWSDNDVTLWPGQSQTLTATYSASQLGSANPVVSVYGWNVANAVFAAPQTQAAASAVTAAQTAAGIQQFGVANGTPGQTGSATPDTGTEPGAAVPASTTVGGVSWKITSVANSAGTTPPTSFTQGDSADTYTITLTNTGSQPTDGTTPVTVTDVVDPNISLQSISGTGWTCSTSNDPTETCTQTGGAGGAPAVLQPGQSYPPITLTVSVPRTAGFGTQESTDGLHVTNTVTVTGGVPGGAAGGPTATKSSATPIAGLPDLTADDATDGSFTQGDAGDQYQITVINQGGGPTNGSASAPVRATVSGMPTGQVIKSLYGSGWTCNLTAITSPVTEPANTCYRSDVLQGENGEEPPITVVASTAVNAPATGTLTAVIGGGGDAASPASTTASATILQSPDLTATSAHTGNFTQGDASDNYTLTVKNVIGPNSTAGGPSYGLVTVADSVPWGLTATGLSGTGWTCNLAAVTCYRSDALAAGATYPAITLTVSVAASAPASVVNSVTVSGGSMTTGPNSSTANGGQTGTDPTTITQTGTAGTPPSPPAAPSLSVASVHSGGFGQGDASDAYALTVSDAGGAGATSGMVVVTDTLPAGLTPTEMTGSGWTCSLAPATLPPTVAARRSSVVNNYEPDPTCYRFDSLGAGQSYPAITLDVAVANDAQPSVTNSVSVSGGGNGGTVTGTDTTAIAQRAQLATVSIDTASIGTAAGVPYAPFITGKTARNTYQITVANDGFAATSGQITVTTDLPAGLTATSISGAGWTCYRSKAICRSQPGFTLAAGAESAITVSVRVTGTNPPLSALTFITATGGGAIQSAQIDENNDYNLLENGGTYVDPTYVAATGAAG